MLKFIIVAEAEADARHIRSLADRVFLEGGSQWIDENLLPSLCRWSGFESGTSYTKRAEIRDLGVKYKLPRYLGHIQGQPQGVDCAQSRKAIALSLRAQETRVIGALVLARDLDDQPERRDGILQARSGAQGKVEVIVATPNPKREAWVLNGFVCKGRREKQDLESLRQELGFDPCKQAERLRSHTKTDSPERDLKRIVERLTGGDFSREQECWTKTPLSILRERGGGTYLKEFIEEVETQLLPLLDPSRQRR